MPIHGYKPSAGPCRICGDGFEHQTRAGAPDISQCPKCGQNVERLTDVPGPRGRSRSSTISSAKQAGFTILRRTGGGGFEKL
jgi:hypothetical protein